MARETNLNYSTVQLGLSDMINSNIASMNFTNQRSVITWYLKLINIIFLLLKNISDFIINFLPFLFYVNILLHTHYSTTIWKYKEKFTKEAS